MHPFERWHRAYIALTTGAIALVSILCGFLYWAFAIGLVVGGIWLALYTPADGGWLVLVVFVIAAGVLVLCGAKYVFEALPGITPRRINQAPGQSRFAGRNDLRRHRII